jgi:hypothetical protein
LQFAFKIKVDGFEIKNIIVVINYLDLKSISSLTTYLYQTLLIVKNQKPMPKFNLKNLLIIVISIALIAGLSYSTLRFALSKDNVSFPKKDHSHFRVKYIFNGQEENFGSPRYQTDYTKDICNGTLTESPLHFHDNKTDYQHMHWARMTGGQMLKFYGLNYIGGINGYMGFELDKFPQIVAVPTHSNSLPQPRPNNKFWVYTGLENTDGSWAIKSKTFEEFINQDFETFFGKESQVRKDIEKYGVSYMNILDSVKAQAHSEVEHKTLNEEQKHNLELGEKANTEKLNNQSIESLTAATMSSQPQQNSKTIPLQSKIITENKEVKLFQAAPSNTPEIDPVTGEELKSINNFLGDVVIFVQPDVPTPEQIQARFQSMVKLDKSVCGG